MISRKDRLNTLTNLRFIGFAVQTRNEVKGFTRCSHPDLLPQQQIGLPVYGNFIHESTVSAVVFQDNLVSQQLDHTMFSGNPGDPPLNLDTGFAGSFFQTNDQGCFRYGIGQMAVQDVGGVLLLPGVFLGFFI